MMLWCLKLVSSPSITEHMTNLVTYELGPEESIADKLTTIDILDLTPMYSYMLTCDNLYDILTNERDRVRMFMIIIEVYITTSEIIVESDELMEMCFVDIYESVYVELGSLLHRHYNIDPGVCDSKLKDLIFSMLELCVKRKELTYTKNYIRYVISWEFSGNKKMIHVGSVIGGRE